MTKVVSIKGIIEATFSFPFFSFLFITVILPVLWKWRVSSHIPLFLMISIGIATGMALVEARSMRWAVWISTMNEISFFSLQSCVRAHGAIIRHICLTFIFYFIFVSFYWKNKIRMHPLLPVLDIYDLWWWWWWCHSFVRAPEPSPRPHSTSGGTALIRYGVRILQSHQEGLEFDCWDPNREW